MRRLSSAPTAPVILVPPPGPDHYPGPLRRRRLGRTLLAMALVGVGLTVFGRYQLTIPSDSESSLQSVKVSATPAAPGHPRSRPLPSRRNRQPE
jgi:hypothetical protein